MQKSYTKEFKLKAVHEVIKKNKKVKDVAVELNIPIGNIYKWITIFKQDGVFYGKGHSKNKEKETIRQLEVENQILKKALFLSDETEVIFEFIYEHKSIFPIQTMCRVLKVSSSGYYKFAKRITSKQQLKYNQVTTLVKDIYIEKGPNIGSPKITEIINKKEIITSQATVARILQENKSDWHASYSKFHDNKDVVLEFHNKDTLFDIDNNRYYHENLAQSEIMSLLDATTFTNLKQYTGNTIKNVDNYSSKDNLLIHGDNLFALHKLKATFNKKVKLIYIDPPYNTERYDLSYEDRYSRPNYLLFLKNRLDVARELLRTDGSIFIHCDDNEQAYIKVLCDEIFGEENFVNQIIWKRKSSQQNRSQIATTKDYILVYAKNKKHLKLNKVALTSQQLDTYKYQDSKGKFRVDKLMNKKNGYYSYNITTPSGKIITNKWDYPYITFKHLLEKELVYWSKNEIPYKKVYLQDNSSSIMNDLWISNEDYGSINEANAELKHVIGHNDFTYPKPEKLLKQIIELATNENDLILDFFAGSGTTASTAYRLNRNFILVEKEIDTFNLIIERLKKVITSIVNSLKTDDSFITCHIRKK